MKATPDGLEEGKTYRGTITFEGVVAGQKVSVYECFTLYVATPGKSLNEKHILKYGECEDNKDNQPGDGSNNGDNNGNDGNDGRPRADQRRGSLGTRPTRLKTPSTTKRRKNARHRNQSPDAAGERYSLEVPKRNVNCT